MIAKLLRFFAAERADRHALARAWFALLGARLLLWIAPFEKIMSLAPARTRERNSLSDCAATSRLSWAVRTAARYVPLSTCLSQALALQYLLNLEGIGSELKIGVARMAQGEFAAHAWVESHGRILIGSAPNLMSYRQFPL